MVGPKGCGFPCSPSQGSVVLGMTGFGGHPLLRLSPDGEGLLRRLVDRGAIAWPWNWFSCFPSGRKPGDLGPFDLGNCLFRRFPECGAGIEVGYVGNVATVLLTVEDVYVVVVHGPSLIFRCTFIAFSIAGKNRRGTVPLKPCSRFLSTVRIWSAFMRESTASPAVP